MKNSFFRLALLACWPVFFLKNAAPPDVQLPTSNVVQWLTETEHDFGQVRQGSQTKFVFKFKNLDTQPVVVETVRTSCGCTAAKWTEEAVLPGASGEIVIEYDSENRGDFRKKIRVFFDRQKKAEILYVQGEVVE